jgi:hypothetical protein
MMFDFFSKKLKKVKYALLVKKTAREWAEKPEYQRGYRKWPDGTPKTFCNIMVMKLLVFLGYDIKCMLDPLGIDYTTPYEMIKGCLDRLGKNCKEVSAKAAQALGNFGEMVIAASAFPKYNHVAIVVADPNKYNPEKGPLITQAGGINGTFYVSNIPAWGKMWEDPRVRYFHIFSSNRKEK